MLATLSQGTCVDVFHLAEYQSGIVNAQRRLELLAAARGITLRFTCACRLENRPSALGGLDVLMPSRWSASAIPDRYRNARSIPRTAFREPDLFGDGPLFEDALERDTVERALLRVGCDIALWPKKDGAIRPLGFGPTPALGFGALTFSYHNVPNTVPPAFWWQVPGRPDVWFPLVPRRI